MKLKRMKQVMTITLAVCLGVTSVPWERLQVYAEEEGQILEEKAIVEKSEGEGNSSQEDVMIIGEEENLREEYSKTFLRDDGRYTTVLSSEPLHYKAEGTARWQEIDNTLKEQANSTGQVYYTNTSNDFKVALPEDIGGQSEVVVSKGEYSVSFILEETKSSQLRTLGEESVINNLKEEETEEEQVSEQNLLLEREIIEEQSIASQAMDDAINEINLDASAYYENVLENTDIEYCMQGKSLKESILVSEISEEEIMYSYLIKVKGLNLVLNEDQSIDLKSNGKIIFKVNVKSSALNFNPIHAKL